MYKMTWLYFIIGFHVMNAYCQPVVTLSPNGTMLSDEIPKQTEEDAPVVNIHIIGVGSIICASVFLIIVGTYMAYVHCKLHKSYATYSGGEYIQQGPAFPSRQNESRPIRVGQLPPIPIASTQEYILVLPEDRANSTAATDMENAAYLIPRHLLKPVSIPSTTLTNQSEVKILSSVNVYDTLQSNSTLADNDSGYVPMSPLQRQLPAVPARMVLKDKE